MEVGPPRRKRDSYRVERHHDFNQGEPLEGDRNFYRGRKTKNPTNYRNCKLNLHKMRQKTSLTKDCPRYIYLFEWQNQSWLVNLFQSFTVVAVTPYQVWKRPALTCMNFQAGPSFFMLVCCGLVNQLFEKELLWLKQLGFFWGGGAVL